MAESKPVRNEAGQPGRESAGLQRGGERTPARRDDSGWWNDPSEFFRTSPFGMMRRMSEEMDRMMSNFWGGAGERGWSPALEVAERDGNLVVCAELPGLDKDDVRLEIRDDSLVIQGERKREHEERRQGLYRSERSYGSFYRAVPLPEHAKAEDARANFHNGVLEVTVPLDRAKERSRQIRIESGEPGRKPTATAGSRTEDQRKSA